MPISKTPASALFFDDFTVPIDSDFIALFSIASAKDINRLAIVVGALTDKSYAVIAIAMKHIMDVARAVHINQGT